MTGKDLSLIESEIIESKIYSIRGQRVMIDSDLAVLYEIETFNLNKAVKRNIDRFPKDFMFQLKKEEYQSLLFQFGISSCHGGRRTLPNAFTEQGVAMLSSVLKSKKAVQVNIAIMRTFVKCREFIAMNTEIASKLKELEEAIKGNRSDIKLIFATINTMLNPRTNRKPKIGFKPDEDL
jgi:hypothetical protein